MRVSTRFLFVLAVFGCDPGILDPILTGGGSGGSASGPASTTTDPTPESTSTGMDGSTGAVSGDSTCTSCEDPTGAVFIVPSDPPAACDVYAQDCESGFKCTAEGPPPLDSGSIVCSPIVAEPDQAGESCQQLVLGHLGPDTCDVGLFCDDADPQTGIGTCAVMCQGSPNQPMCAGGLACLGYQELPLCVPHCDPLLQDCPAGDSCQYAGVDFACVAVSNLPANQLFEGCGGDWQCAPGLSCVDEEAAVECSGGGDGPGCCLPYCALDNPACPGVGQQCRPFYDPGDAPAGLENVGVCALP